MLGVRMTPQSKTGGIPQFLLQFSSFSCWLMLSVIKLTTTFITGNVIKVKVLLCRLFDSLICFWYYVTSKSQVGDSRKQRWYRDVTKPMSAPFHVREDLLFSGIHETRPMIDEDSERLFLIFKVLWNQKWWQNGDDSWARMGWNGRESQCCCALHSFWIKVTDIIFSDRSLPVTAVTWGAGVCAQIQTLCLWQIGRNSSVTHRASPRISKRCQNTLFGCFSGGGGG